MVLRVLTALGTFVLGVAGGYLASKAWAETA
jgi:hypothetical protein